MLSEVGVSNGVFIQVEERVGRPPRDGIKGVNEVAGTALLFTVILARGVHPVDHLVERITGLVVTPIPINQPTESHRDGAEVVLERGVV